MNVFSHLTWGSSITQLFHALQMVCNHQEENFLSLPLMVHLLVGSLVRCFLCVVEAAFVVMRAIRIKQDEHRTD